MPTREMRPSIQAALVQLKSNPRKEDEAWQWFCIGDELQRLGRDIKSSKVFGHASFHVQSPKVCNAARRASAFSYSALAFSSCSGAQSGRRTGTVCLSAVLTR